MRSRMASAFITRRAVRLGIAGRCAEVQSRRRADDHERTARRRASEDRDEVRRESRHLIEERDEAQD
jgi:hypothetical protein